MSDLTVKIARSDPEVRDHVRAMRMGMSKMTKQVEAAQRAERDMFAENQRLRQRIAELESKP